MPKNGDDDGETVKSARTRLFEVLAITGTAFDDLVVQRLTLNDGNEGNKCAVTKISRDSPCADNPDIVVFRKGGLNPVCCSKDMTTDKPKGGRPKNSREHSCVHKKQTQQHGRERPQQHRKVHCFLDASVSTHVFLIFMNIRKVFLELFFGVSVRSQHCCIKSATRRRHPFRMRFHTGSFRGIAVPKTSAGLQSEGWLDGMMQQAWLRIVPERKNSETRSETQGPIHV